MPDLISCIKLSSGIKYGASRLPCGLYSSCLAMSVDINRLRALHVTCGFLLKRMLIGIGMLVSSICSTIFGADLDRAYILSTWHIERRTSLKEISGFEVQFVLLHRHYSTGQSSTRGLWVKPKTLHTTTSSFSTSSSRAAASATPSTSFWD